MRRTAVTILLALSLTTAATAQRRPPPAPPIASQTDLIVRAGSDTVLFPAGSFDLDATARATLAGQARALQTNPFLSVTLEGHGDPADTRNHALALGERRAAAVRNFLVSLGVEPARLTVVSWGKERPVGDRVDHVRSRRVQTILAR